MSPFSRFYSVLGAEPFRYNNYYIESVRMEDAEAIRTWRNEQISALRQEQTLAKEEQSTYFERLLSEDFPISKPKQVLVRFMLEGNLIGYGGIVHIDWRNLHAEVSFLLETSRTSNHSRYSNELFIFFQLIKQAAFVKLKLNKLTCEAYAHRKYHVDAIERTGFVREGVLRQQSFINGEWVDAVVSSCLRSEHIGLDTNNL
jgi:RimJ/RimL family protein N-acetyltransferase